MHKHFAVFGGQYGSEGKASSAEHWVKKLISSGNKVYVIGDNSPSSGHTSSLGSTKNLPATSFWADGVLLGPDSVIDPELTIHDWEVTGKKPLFIHENAAIVDNKIREDGHVEAIDLVKRISSTGSGSGLARKRKFFQRLPDSVISIKKDFPDGISVVTRNEWRNLVSQMHPHGVIFECSQGLLLDTNLGRFPFCSSRSTNPRTAIERNGVGNFEWLYCGVYRTYPIRTGGPSGPTGGVEITFESLGVKREITTVTKRIRRIFEFNVDDFLYSLQIGRPDVLMFTFLDYIGLTSADSKGFKEWLEYHGIENIRRMPIWLSNETGKFNYYERN